jgi:hypothetical protein
MKKWWLVNTLLFATACNSSSTTNKGLESKVAPSQKIEKPLIVQPPKLEHSLYTIISNPITKPKPIKTPTVRKPIVIKTPEIPKTIWWQDLHNSIEPLRKSKVKVPSYVNGILIENRNPYSLMYELGFITKSLYSIKRLPGIKPILTEYLNEVNTSLSTVWKGTYELEYKETENKDLSNKKANSVVSPAKSFFTRFN